MPRYEFAEGSSNKFWEIQLNGSSFTTTYGKIGTSGATSVKKWKDAAQAKLEYARLVAEKTKKGYTLVGGKRAPKAAAAPATAARSSTASGGTRDARNPTLEQAIAADPFDREAYAVFGDWLQEQGDPRGELIALQLANKDKSAKALIDRKADYFLGPLAAHQQTRDGRLSEASRLRTPAQEKEWQKTARHAFLWRNGFIYRVRLSHNIWGDREWKGKTVDVLDEVLRHPSGRYVVELSFLSNGNPIDANLQDLIDLLGKRAPATTRKITFGDSVDQVSWHHTGKLGKLWTGVPNLRVLEIETGDFDVGKMVAPALERAIFITGGLSRSCGNNVATATMPKIKHLEIYYGAGRYGGDCTIKQVLPLLARTDLPDLEYLGLKNSTFQDAIAKAIAGSKLVRQLETLDLSMGTMTDEGAHALAAAKSSLPNLEVLDLHGNYLTKDGINAVKGLAPHVDTSKQREPDADGEETYYYVSVAE